MPGYKSSSEEVCNVNHRAWQNPMPRMLLCNVILCNRITCTAVQVTVHIEKLGERHRTANERLVSQRVVTLQ